VTVTVVVAGCDDETTVEIEVNDVEEDLLVRLSKLINETREYGCMPGMTVSKDGEALVRLL
jgi:hypothetical protein